MLGGWDVELVGGLGGKEEEMEDKVHLVPVRASVLSADADVVPFVAI